MSAEALVTALDPLVGVVLLVGGILAWRFRPASRVGALFVLTGVCWFVGALVPALALLHRGPLVQLLLTFPTGRTHQPRTRAAVVLGWALAVAGVFVGGGWPELLLAVLLGVSAVERTRDLATPARHVAGPVIAAMLSVAAVLVISTVNIQGDLDADLAVVALYDVVVAVVAVALCTTLLRWTWTEDALVDLVTGLGAQDDAQHGVESRLRRILDDPELTIGYWSPDRQGYLDEHGRPVPDAPGGGPPPLTDDERPTAILLHGVPVVDDPQLVDGLSAAARLAHDNSAMRREARSRIARLTEARRRLEEAADLERAALARRLDLGARGHLDRVDTLLDELAVDGPDAEARETLRHELALARRELQDLAHGVRPRALAEGGLSTALPVLAERSPLPTTVEAPAGRLAPSVEAGLYFFCAEALANAAKHSGAGHVRVSVRRVPGFVLAEVEDDGVGGADPEGAGLRGLSDRMEALGGHLAVGRSATGGVLLLARVPVATEEPR
ncbi:sensor histidine kinase [Mumia sp. DW29H23]|uniref:sensor histidine kinase n=1 Tax=Mumia sp. DW29H23 TaxID=3421241 RepID=UPI003D6871C6